MKKLLGLLAVLMIAPMGAAQEDEEKKGGTQDRNKGPTPEELLKRRESFYDLCRDREVKWSGWSAKLHIAQTDPVADATTHRDGTLWVRKMGKDDKAKKEWAPRELAWEVGQKMPDKMGNMKYTVLEAGTYKETELQRGELWRKKSLEIYNMNYWDVFFFEQIARDGFSKDLEEKFTVRIMVDPRFHKDAPTAEDMKHLGYESAEAMDKALNEKEATSNGGGKTGLKENRPFRDKEDKFDEYRRKKDGHNKEVEGTTGTKLYYQIGMVPTDGKLKRAVKRIIVYLHTEDYYPAKMIIQYPGDRTVVMDLKDRKDMDVEEPYPDENFKIQRTGLTVTRPQTD